MAEGSQWGRPEGEAETRDGSPDGAGDDSAKAPQAHIPDDASTAAVEPTIVVDEARDAIGDSSTEPDVKVPGETIASDGRSGTSTDDAIEADAVEPAALEPAASMAKDSSGSAVIAILGLMLLVLSALVVGLVVFATRDTSEDYPTDLENDQYDLASMSLRQIDTPPGLNLAGRIEFNNEEWAALIDEIDPEARLPQLNAQERVRNHISIFGWDDGGTFHLAQTLSVLSQSTLYETEAAAQEAITGTALCGLRLNEAAPIDEFEVPAIGEQSVGFFLTETDEQIGKSIETVVCFRTGRIVHGVVQSALDGAQDIGLVVNMAQAMLGHVDASFDGNPDPMDEDPNEGG